MFLRPRPLDSWKTPLFYKLHNGKRFEASLQQKYQNPVLQRGRQISKRGVPDRFQLGEGGATAPSCPPESATVSDHKEGPGYSYLKHILSSKRKHKLYTVEELQNYCWSAEPSQILMKCELETFNVRAQETIYRVQHFCAYYFSLGFFSLHGLSSTLKKYIIVPQTLSVYGMFLLVVIASWNSNSLSTV